MMIFCTPVEGLKDRQFLRRLPDFFGNYFLENRAVTITCHAEFSYFRDRAAGDFLAVTVHKRHDGIDTQVKRQVVA